MRSSAHALAACAFLLPAAALADHHEGGEKGDAPDIKGAYKITAGEKYGEKIPTARLSDNRVTVTDKQIAVVDKDKKDLYASDYRIAAPVKGKAGVYEINLVSTIPAPGKAMGLVMVEYEKKKDGAAGDDEKKIKALKLIYSLGGDRPKDFRTGPKELLFVLTPIAEPAEKDAEDAEEDGGADDA